MEPPPSSPMGSGAGAVCCMCGDRGLPHELVRCKLCRVRLQHRYCSDMYPRATAYRRCNWCLREPAAEAHAHAVASKTAEKRKAVASTETSASEEEEGELQWHEAATRSAAEVGKPVKKPKVDERAALPPSPGSPAKKNNGDKKPMQAGKLALPPSPGSPAKKSNGEKKPMQAVKLAPSPGSAAKGSNGDKEPMQAGKLARPGRVKVRRYRLLAEVISC